MKKYFYKQIAAFICLSIVVFMGCSDNENFPNKPQPIDVNSVEIAPIAGGFDVKWTPNPADENFIFLHMEFTDQDGKARSYNMSRFGSNLVTPELPDKDGNPYPNPNEEVSVTINGLVNQSYTIRFTAFNDSNESIYLGSREVTPGDYTQCLPDSIFAINLQTGGGKKVFLEWRELELTSSSTMAKVYFKFTNLLSKEVTTKEYLPGIYHDEFKMDEAGEYSVECGTVSEIGNKWSKQLKNIKVIQFSSLEKWTADQKRGWQVTGSSVQDSEGPYRNLIDGSNTTYWASNWGDSSTKYTLDITLDKVEEIVGVILQQRHNCSKPSWHRCVKDFSIYVKENESDAFPDEPIYRGQLKENEDPNGGDFTGKQEFKFDSMAKTKYIRLSLDSAMFPNTSNNTAFCMAEFGLFVKDPSIGE